MDFIKLNPDEEQTCCVLHSWLIEKRYASLLNETCNLWPFAALQREIKNQCSNTIGSRDLSRLEHTCAWQE